MKDLDSGERWGSRYGFLASAVGAAVGLGNLWAFPRRFSEQGGAFLLVYLALTLLVGVPLLMCELAIGRMSRTGSRGAGRVLPGGGSLPGRLASLLPSAASFCVLCFYQVIGGACLREFFGRLSLLLGGAPDPFPVFAEDPGRVALWACVFGLLCCGVVLGGLTGGIERCSRLGMPALFLLLLAVAVRSLREEGAAFLALLKPDPGLLLHRPMAVCSAAAGQMLFSLSVGAGCMVSYGACLPSTENIPRSALRIALLDTLMALLAAAAVLPAGGGETGPALLFLAMQRVFDGFGAAGPVFGALFYGGAALAALTSAVSYLETLASWGRGPAGRRKAAVAAALLAVTVSVFAARGAFGGGRSLLRFLDTTAEGVLLPLSALCGVLWAGYLIRPRRLWHELCQDAPHRGRRLFTLSVLLICPLVILFVMLWG